MCLHMQWPVWHCVLLPANAPKRTRQRQGRHKGTLFHVWVRRFTFASVTGTLSSLAVTVPVSAALTGHVLYSRPNTEENWAPLWMLMWGVPLSLGLGCIAGCVAMATKAEVLDLGAGYDGDVETGRAPNDKP